MRLIDADTLCDAVAKSKDSNPHAPGMVRVNHRNEHNHFLRLIHDAQTIDAVTVVRCKYCKNNEVIRVGCFYSWCKEHCRHVTDDDFCSYGERKDGDDNG